MKIDKVIEILGDLQSYIEDNWDKEEYGEEIKENVEALEIAINAIQSSNVVGNLTIGNKQYIVSKSK
jgi:translation initiation factor 6 (eIF-6)